MGAFTSAYAGSKGHGSAAVAGCQPAVPGLAPISAREPYPAYSNILMTESGGNSEYQSLQFFFKRQLASGCGYWRRIRFRNRLTIRPRSCQLRPIRIFRRTATTTGWNGPFELRCAESCHRRVGVRIPGSSRWARGFELSSIITARERPAFYARAFDATTATRATAAATSASTGRTCCLTRRSRTRRRRNGSTSAAFAVPPQYTWGDAGRNILRGPGLVTVDLSLRRHFCAARERMHLTAEAQSFNTLNRANFNLPDAFADQPLTFGKIFSAKDPRQIQFALRLAYLSRPARV